MKLVLQKTAVRGTGTGGPVEIPRDFGPGDEEVSALIERRTFGVSGAQQRKGGTMYISIGAAILILILLIIFVF